MHSKNNISKAALFLVITLLFSSFKFSDWKFNKEYIAEIQKSISNLFNSDPYNFEELKEFEEVFYAIKKADVVLGYFVVAKAPSKFHKFDYYIMFDKKGMILKVEVLRYRENYGAEICNKRWLKKFINTSTSNFAQYNRKIDGISGATISVNSIKKDVFLLSNMLKEKIK